MAKKCGCGFADWLLKHKRISKPKHASMCKKAKAKCARRGRRYKKK